MNSQIASPPVLSVVDSQDAIEILRELIRGQSSGEPEVQQVVAALLAAAGGQVERISYETLASVAPRSPFGGARQ